MILSLLTGFGLRVTFSVPQTSLFAKPVPATVPGVYIDYEPAHAERASAHHARIAHTQTKDKVAPAATPIPTTLRSNVALTPHSNSRASERTSVTSRAPDAGMGNLETWQSLFNWTTLAMIVTPKPQLHKTRRNVQRSIAKIPS